MKNKHLLRTGSIFIGLLISFIVTLNAQDDTVTAYAFTSEPTIDGVIDEAWSTNDFLQISHPITSNYPPAEEDFSGQFKISWFNNALYFLFVVTDDILIRNEGQEIWYGDNINLYLDLGNEKQPVYDNNDYLCQLKWGNSDYYERYNGSDLIQVNNHTEVEFAQICDTINHTFVMEISLRNLDALNGPAELNESTSIGLDVGIYDLDETFGMFSDHLSWIDTTGLAWSDPSRHGTAGFGTIMLKESSEPNSIGKPGAKSLVKIYPTLASDRLTIQSSINGELKIDIINMLGKRVDTKIIGSENAGLDVSDLKPGVYYVNVYSAMKSIGSQKIIVVR
jgi:hypothetical protein